MPLAIVNGANYLKPRAEEMSDGAFFGGVAETASCGLVVDLGNVWAGARRGREMPRAFVDQLPLHWVWELRVPFRGEQTRPLAVVRDILPLLPNLRAVILEIGPAVLPTLSRESLRRDLDRLLVLWEHQRGAAPSPDAGTRSADDRLVHSGGDPEEWEDALGALVVGRPGPNGLAAELGSDPGLRVYRRLASERRQAAFSAALPFSSRLLLLARGTEEIRRLLEAFWRRESVEDLGDGDVRRLAAFLGDQVRDLALLVPLLAYDVAVLDALTTGERTLVAFDHDPRPTLSALADGRLPRQPGLGPPYEIEVWSDGIAIRPLAAHRD